MLPEHIKNAYLPVVKRPDAMNDNLPSPSEQNKDPLKVDRSERIQLVKVANEREREINEASVQCQGRSSTCAEMQILNSGQTDGHVASHDVENQSLGGLQNSGC